MTAFLVKGILAVVILIAAKFVPKVFAPNRREDEEQKAQHNMIVRIARGCMLAVAGLLIFWAVIGTSVVWVPAGNVATLNRVYLGKSLPPGRIVALNGELGPQARMLTPGFHIEMFVTLTCKIEYEPMVNIPSGSCALMSAKDGKSINGGSAFAEPWTDANKTLMANDATFFLTKGGGERGPQTTILTPGMYTINPYLWEKPKVIVATRIEQGTVGVVKSSVAALVDFGAFKREKPTSNELKISNGLEGQAKVLLVPVGAIGVWEEALPNGLYYINTEAYKVTHVPTIAQVYEYKGGYKRRTAEVSIDDKGKIIEKIVEVEVQPVPQSADTAIFAKPEGWDVPQELRVLAQISPDRAPFVAAALGLTGENTNDVIENRVVTPIIRSVVRDVLGGAPIAVKQMKAIVGADGNPVIDETTNEPKTQLVHEFRPVKVLDLLENRSSLEDAIEERARPQADKEGVAIMEVLLSDSCIPAEMLIARKREQLAQQLTKAWKQEELAQTQRQELENARAVAEQQSTLVESEMLAKAAENKKKARETEGMGEQAYLSAIAEGQKSQSEVLGKDVTAVLQMVQMIVKVIQDNPELVTSALTNAKKFVPDVVVGGGGSNDLAGAAAIFGRMMNGNPLASASPDVAPATPAPATVQ